MVTQLNRKSDEVISDNSEMRNECDKTSDYLAHMAMNIENMGTKMEEMTEQ